MGRTCEIGLDLEGGPEQVGGGSRVAGDGGGGGSGGGASEGASALGSRGRGGAAGGPGGGLAELPLLHEQRRRGGEGRLKKLKTILFGGTHKRFLCHLHCGARSGPDRMEPFQKNH